MFWRNLSQSYGNARQRHTYYLRYSKYYWAVLFQLLIDGVMASVVALSDWLIDFWCLAPLSAIFQRYHDDLF